MRTSRRIGGIAAAFLFIVWTAGAAHAQDAPWSGAHVGAELGIRGQRVTIGSAEEGVGQVTGVNINGIGLVSVAGTTITAPEAKVSDTGVLGGIEAGADMQRGMWVGGAAIDLDFGHKTSTADFSSTVPATALTPVTSITTTRTVQGTSGASFRLRAGAAFGDNLAYVTGGLVAARVRLNASGTWSDPGGPAATTVGAFTANLGPLGPNVTTIPETTHLKAGWTLGFGVERHISPALSAALEYRHTALGGTDFDTTGAQTTFQGTLTGNTSTSGFSAGGAQNGSVTPGPASVKVSDNRLNLRLSWWVHL